MKKPRRPVSPPGAPDPRRERATLSDDELWARATSGVTPLSGVAPAKRRRPAAAGGSPASPGPGAHADEGSFEDLLAREGGLDVEETAQSIRARVPELDVDVLRRLARGAFAPEDRLDLHGHVVADVERLLPAFVGVSRMRGRRCVLVIHGRGSGAVRGAVCAWLLSAAARAHLLAFATATPRDGGAGALYVLLRR